MPKLKSWARIALAVLCLSGAIAISGLVGRCSIDRAWLWAILPLVVIAVLLMLDEIVHRLNRAIGTAIERRRSEITSEINTKQVVDGSPRRPTQDGY